MAEEKLHYTPQEVAAAMQVSPATVYGWIHDGRILAIPAGKMFRIPNQEYRRIMKEGTKPAGTFKDLRKIRRGFS